jgi:integrase
MRGHFTGSQRRYIAMPKGIFRRYDCPQCVKPGVYRRKPGLCPKCGTQLKKGPLCIQYLQRGSRKTETVKSNSIKYAEALLHKRLREGFVVPKKLKWGVLAGEWLDLVAVNHADGGERARYAVARLKEYFGELPIGEMQRADLLGYVNQRGKEVKSATLAKEVRTFRAIWTHARQSGYIETQPWEGIAVNEGLPPIKQPITQAEKTRLFEALPECSRPIYLFMILTGCRGKEARFLRKADVDMGQGIVWVKGKTAKGEERQPLILCAEALEVVKAASRGKSPWLFPNVKTGEPYTNIKSTFSRAVERSGLKGKVRGPHDLRHLFVSQLIQAGVDHVTAAALSRHKDLRMLQRYTHLSPDHLRETLEKSKKNSKGNAKGKK